MSGYTRDSGQIARSLGKREGSFQQAQKQSDCIRKFYVCGLSNIVGLAVFARYVPFLSFRTTGNFIPHICEVLNLSRSILMHKRALFLIAQRNCSN